MPIKPQLSLGLGSSDRTKEVTKEYLTFTTSQFPWPLESSDFEKQGKKPTQELHEASKTPPSPHREARRQ
jgi:hypothetical protein